MSRRSQRRLSRRKAEWNDPRDVYVEHRGRPPAYKDELTDELVSSLLPRSSEYAVHDLVQEGLFVRIRPSGSKSYYYRHKGSRNRKAVSLGSFKQLAIRDARLKVADFERRIAEGTSIGQLGSKSSAGSVSKAFDAYGKARNGAAWSIRIRREFQNVILPVLGDEKLVSLTFEQLDNLIRSRSTYYGRRNLRSILSGFLSWCVNTGRLDTNVLKGGRLEKRPPANKRELNATEIKFVWDACDCLPRLWRDAFRLVIASGLPMREVLNFPSDILTQRGDDAIILCAQAEEIIAQIPKTNSPYLFSAPGKTMPMAFQQGILVQLCEAAQIGFFTAGKLQRSSIALADIRTKRGSRSNDFSPLSRSGDLHHDSVEL